jgi:muramoyltetrapeptide carboxypeptidase LdcA involved in peptidoglycan recycling
MRYGKFLPNGGTIGFIAPSFGCATEPYIQEFDSAIDKFLGMGYSVDIGPDCSEDKGIGISNTPEKCGEEINSYFPSVENDVLISCGGGELMCQDLPFVDFDLIREAPAKWFMGYSDNTNLTFLLPTLTDTAAIYGPCVSSFGSEKWHESIYDAMNVLTGKSLTVHAYDMWERESLKDEEHPFASYNLTEKNNVISYIPGEKDLVTTSILPREKDLTGSPISPVIKGNENETEFSGRLIGGCLDCLGTLVGTRFDKAAEFCDRYADDGIIWFFESCELNTMSIRRYIWQLDQAGWFKNVKGFLIGRPFMFDQPIMGLDQYDAVIGILRKYNVPIIMDLDIGHLPPMMPLIEGSLADVRLSENDFQITMNLG